jgi:polar amino acid transport system substrate-binding protein
MSVRSVQCVVLLLCFAAVLVGKARADELRSEIAPTGKLRVAIGISAAGGAFWSMKTAGGGYAGVPVDLGKEMAAQLGLPVEYVPFQNSGQITDAASKGAWDVTFLPRDAERDTKMSFGPVYEVADATYIIRRDRRSRILQRSINRASRSRRSTTPRPCVERRPI